VGNALRALAAGELLDTTGALDVSGTWLGRVGRRLSGAFSRVFGKPPRVNAAGVRDFLYARRAVLLPAVLALATAVYLLSGVYVVGPDQRAVVLRLGRAVAVDVGPGLRWVWPRPIDRIITYRRSYLRRLEVGFRLSHAGVAASPGDAYLWESRHVGGFYEKRAEEALMLTGDENIIDLNLVVQYRIADPAAYLFRVSAPDTFVRAATEAVVRGVVSREPLEALLTTDRRRIADEVVSGLQDLLDQYGAGVEIVSVRLQDVHPPVEVVTAFREVSSAREDRSRLMREAEAYGADALPRARGEAYQALQAAQQTLVQATNRATGEADRFASVMQEYRRARNVTETRLYLGTVDETLTGARKVVVDASIPPGEVDLRLLPPGIREEDVPTRDVPSSQMDMERQLEQMGMGGFLGPGTQQQPLGVPGDPRGR
jgi:HflK protein